MLVMVVTANVVAFLNGLSGFLLAHNTEIHRFCAAKALMSALYLRTRSAGVVIRGCLPVAHSRALLL